MPVNRWFAKTLFWPTFVWNYSIGRILKLRHWWDPVDDVLILGARPLRPDVRQLAKDLQVTGVVNMCEEYPGPTDLYEEYGIEQLWLPTTDFNPPSLEDVTRGVEFIQEQANKGGKVYVHCKAGRARSATVALCWLVKYRDMSPEEAQSHLLKCRPHVHARLPQRAVVQSFCRNLSRGTVEGLEA